MKLNTVCPGIWAANTGTGRGPGTTRGLRDLIWEDMRVGHHKGDGGIWLGRTGGWDTKRGMEGFGLGRHVTGGWDTTRGKEGFGLSRTGGRGTTRGMEGFGLGKQEGGAPQGGWRDLAWENRRVGHHKGDGGIWFGTTGGRVTTSGCRDLAWEDRRVGHHKGGWKDLVRGAGGRAQHWGVEGFGWGVREGEATRGMEGFRFGGQEGGAPAASQGGWRDFVLEARRVGHLQHHKGDGGIWLSNTYEST
jgi:hypothetical protein